MFWNYYRKFFNVLLQNLMHIEYFEIFILKLIKIKYPQLVPNTRSGRGMRCDEAPILEVSDSKGAGRPRLTHHHKGWWNETDEMSVEKWWNEICGRGKREKPREKPTLTPFRPPRNPHGRTETRTRDPSAAVGGERLTACATRPPLKLIIKLIST